MFLKRAVWILGIGLLLTACRGNGPQPTSVFPTPLPATRTPTRSSTAPPTLTLPPLPPTSTFPPPTETLTPTAQPPCANDATFVTDLTVPDGAQFLPGQPLVKKWNVTNSGTCDWGPDYRLVLVSGDSMGAPSEAALYPAKAGTPATLELQMTAPLNPGEYTGRWQARDPQGNLFGAVVFIKIEVIPLPAPNPS